MIFIQSTTGIDKPPFNRTSKNRDVSYRASEIGNLLTPDQSSARSKATPRVKRHNHFSRPRTSRYRSTSVKDQIFPPELVYNITVVI